MDVLSRFKSDGLPLLAGLAVLAGCQSDRPEPTNEVPAVPTVEEVREEPLSFYGKTVTLVGEVDEVHGDQSFELEGNDWLFDHELLVLTKTPAFVGGRRLADGDDVVVSGVIRPLIITEVERELGWDLEQQIEVEFEEKPVFVARTIRSIDDYGYWSEEDEPKGAVASLSALQDDVIDPLIGQRIRLDAMPVQAMAAKGVWIGDSHRQQVFVATPDGTDPASMSVGQSVDVRGTLRKMPPPDDAMKQFEFEPSLRAQISDEMLYIEASQIEAAQGQGDQQGAGQQPAKTVTVAVYATEPTAHVGVAVQGEARVKEVISDRAFWIEGAEGKQLLTVLHEADPEVLDINPGQRIQLEIALALDPKAAKDLAGDLDPEAKQAVAKESVFLAAHWKDVEIVQR